MSTRSSPVKTALACGTFKEQTLRFLRLLRCIVTLITQLVAYLNFVFVAGGARLHHGVTR